MDYINLTAETIAEIRGTKEIIPKLVTDSLTIDFETMPEVEKLMHKLMDDATKALDGKKTYDTWQEGYEHIFQYIINNKEFVVSTFNSLSREFLERYLYNEAYILLIGVVEEKAAGARTGRKAAGGF